MCAQFLAPWPSGRFVIGVALERRCRWRCRPGRSSYFLAVQLYSLYNKRKHNSQNDTTSRTPTPNTFDPTRLDAHARAVEQHAPSRETQAQFTIFKMTPHHTPTRSQLDAHARQLSSTRRHGHPFVLGRSPLRRARSMTLRRGRLRGSQPGQAEAPRRPHRGFAA